VVNSGNFVVMEAKRIKKLKLDMTAYLEKWETKGGKTGGFFCPHCDKPNKTTIPTKKDCGSKGYWDSLTTCYECGGLFMTFRYVGGKILAIKPE
jgi:hypothetical protein